MSSQSLSLCATRVIHLHKTFTARLHLCSVQGRPPLSASTSGFVGSKLSCSSRTRQRWRTSGGSLPAAGRLFVRSKVESAVASEQSLSAALLSGQFVDGVLGVRQPAEIPHENSGASSDLIFLGTGTSEGVPRVSCLTHTSKRCPVTILLLLSCVFILVHDCSGFAFAFAFAFLVEDHSTLHSLRAILHRNPKSKPQISTEMCLNLGCRSSRRPQRNAPVHCQEDRPDPSWEANGT